VLARLVSVRRDGSDGEVFPISEEAVDVGRTSGQLRFEDDPYLSDRHCRFAIQDGGWVVQDLHSRNGIYLRLTDAHQLRNDDCLLLGKQMLRFEWIGESERNIAPAVEHGVMIFGSPLRPPWGRLRQMTVAGVARDVYYLYRSKITIGREDGDLIFPDDEFMSRQHLSLSLVNNRAQAQDLGSSNGTFVRVPDQPRINSGDMLRIGDQLLRFELV
jgi:pSer/pThr/pTyr-binding forkhead associated (FHA) protein